MRIFFNFAKSANSDRTGSGLHIKIKENHKVLATSGSNIVRLTHSLNDGYVDCVAAVSLNVPRKGRCNCGSLAKCKNWPSCGIESLYKVVVVFGIQARNSQQNVNFSIVNHSLKQHTTTQPFIHSHNLFFSSVH